MSCWTQETNSNSNSRPSSLANDLTIQGIMNPKSIRNKAEDLKLNIESIPKQMTLYTIPETDKSHHYPITSTLGNFKYY